MCKESKFSLTGIKWQSINLVEAMKRVITANINEDRHEVETRKFSFHSPFQTSSSIKVRILTLH